MSDSGRNHAPDCLGSTHDANEAALKPILASARKASNSAICDVNSLMPGGRASSGGRGTAGICGGSRRNSGPGWRRGAVPAPRPQDGEAAPAALDEFPALQRKIRDPFVRLHQKNRAERLVHRRHRAARAHGLSRCIIPVRPISNIRTEQIMAARWRPHALSASKCSTPCAAGLPLQQAVGVPPPLPPPPPTPPPHPHTPPPPLPPPATDWVCWRVGSCADRSNLPGNCKRAASTASRPASQVALSPPPPPPPLQKSAPAPATSAVWQGVRSRPRHHHGGSRPPPPPGP